MNHLRAILPEELPALLQLYTHLHATDDPLPDHAQVQAVWNEAMNNPRCRYFGGFADGQLISSCTIMLIPNLTRGCRPYGVVENVVTHADFQRQGWGKALLGAALEFAWSENCYKVMLMTGRKDEATLLFYEGTGFDGQGKQAFVARPPA